MVIIFSTHRLTDDLGSDGVKGAFDAMRAECRQAGLKGLYLLACVHSAAHAQQAGAEGYDAVTGYNWPGLGMNGPGKYAPFETLVDGYRQNWERILEKTPVPLLLPVSGGWDSRPWHGDKNLVRFGRSPELFKRHLLDAKRIAGNRQSEAGPAQPGSHRGLERMGRRLLHRTAQRIRFWLPGRHSRSFHYCACGAHRCHAGGRGAGAL